MRVGGDAAADTTTTPAAPAAAAAAAADAIIAHAGNDEARAAAPSGQVGRESAAKPGHGALHVSMATPPRRGWGGA